MSRRWQPPRLFSPSSMNTLHPISLLALGLAILAGPSEAESGSDSDSEVAGVEADRGGVATAAESSRRASGAGFAEQARYSFQLVSGPLFFPVGIGPDDESFRTIPIDFRLGWWMTPPRGPGWLRGDDSKACSSYRWHRSSRALGVSWWARRSCSATTSCSLGLGWFPISRSGWASSIPTPIGIAARTRSAGP